MFSVVFNIVCYLVTALLVSSLVKKVATGQLTTVQAEAISVLVGRMKYYSVIQIFLISGACWHGFNETTMSSYAARYAYFITAPACGIGYFLVFLYMQPLALKMFQKMVFTTFPALTRLFEKDDTIDELLENGSAPLPVRESQVRKSNVMMLNDEDLTRTIDVRYSATPKGLELSDAVTASHLSVGRVKSTGSKAAKKAAWNKTDDDGNDIEGDGDDDEEDGRSSSVGGPSSVYTGYIPQRPQSVNTINQSIERIRAQQQQQQQQLSDNNLRNREESTDSSASTVAGTVDSRQTAETHFGLSYSNCNSSCSTSHASSDGDSAVNPLQSALIAAASQHQLAGRSLPATPAAVHGGASETERNAAGATMSHHGMLAVVNSSDVVANVVGEMSDEGDGTRPSIAEV